MKRFLSMLAVAALSLVACSSDDAASNTAASTTVADTAPVTEPPADVPDAIVSLSPTATEMLFAIGAGDQLIAVDDMSNYPAESLEKPHDLSGFEPNVEAIAALQPDLVLVQDDKVKDQLEALGIAVWVGPAASSFDDVYTQITELGAATGHVDEAAAVIAEMDAQIAEGYSGASVVSGAAVVSAAAEVSGAPVVDGLAVSLPHAAAVSRKAVSAAIEEKRFISILRFPGESLTGSGGQDRERRRTVAHHPCLEGQSSRPGGRRPDSLREPRGLRTPPLRDSAGISPDFAANRTSSTCEPDRATLTEPPYARHNDPCRDPAPCR